LNEAEISALCASQLVGYKCPSELFVVEDLPMTGNQKLDRIALRQAADNLAVVLP
jgi:long-chain acyl-CoA synthetase